MDAVGGIREVPAVDMVSFSIPEGTEDVFIKVWNYENHRALMVRPAEKIYHPNF